MQLNPRITKEVEQSIEAEFPPCLDWTSVNIYSKVLDVVSVVSGSVFIGPELCSNPTYLAAAKGYSGNLLPGALELKEWPNLLKPFVAKFAARFKAIRKFRADLMEYLEPLVVERKKMMDAGMVPPEDAITWVLREAEEKGQFGPVPVVNVHLFLIMNSIQTTTFAVTRL